MKAVNNFVAKNAPRCGAGRHGKSGKAKRRAEKINLRKEVF